MNCTIHNTNKGFPKKTDVEDMIFLKDVDNIPQDIINYMSISPDFTRSSGAWHWCAPNEICRHKTEPGFTFASQYLGMGHLNMLVWIPKTGHWDVVHMGGANGWEREATHTEWLSHNGLSKHGVRTVQHWMDDFTEQGGFNRFSDLEAGN